MLVVVGLSQYVTTAGADHTVNAASTTGEIIGRFQSAVKYWSKGLDRSLVPRKKIQHYLKC